MHYVTEDITLMHYLFIFVLEALFFCCYHCPSLLDTGGLPSPYPESLRLHSVQCRLSMMQKKSSW